MEHSESLDAKISRLVPRLPGYENIDVVLNTVNEGRRADYLFEDRSIIVEKKEIKAYNFDKNKRILGFFVQLRIKYDFPTSDTIDIENIDDQDRDTLFRIVQNDLDTVKDKIHEANKQVGNTASILGIKDFSGVVLLISDQIENLIPQAISIRAQTALDLPAKHGRKYSNLHSAIIVGRTKGFSIVIAHPGWQAALLRSAS